MANRTLYEKLWDAHVIVRRDDGTSLIYIDRHLIHEVTTPQAFAGLRSSGRRLRRPELTLAVPDHNVSTTQRGGHVADEESAAQLAALEKNCADFGVEYIPIHDVRQGIVHVIGPELGFTLPGITLVCGDSHTATHGAFGALAVGIGTSEIEHVFATQTLWLRQSKTLLVEVEGTLGRGIGAKDLALASVGALGAGGANGHAIEYAGAAVRNLSMEGRMTLCNMAIESGARTGLVAPDATTFAYLEGKPCAPVGTLWEQASNPSHGQSRRAHHSDAEAPTLNRPKDHEHEAETSPPIPEEVVDVDAVVDRAPWSSAQSIVTLLVCLALICDGFDNLAYGLVIPAMSREYSVLPSAFGIVLALGFVGLTVGTIIAGPLGDRIGRKPVLLGCIVLFAFFTLATVSARSVFALAVLRFSVGLGLGGALPNATALIAECTSARHRNFAVTAGALSIIVGGIISAALASVILPHEGWRVLFGIAGAISLLSAPLIYFAVPESPKFLARDVRNSAILRRSLARLRMPYPPNALIKTAVGIEKTRVPIGIIFTADLLRNTLALWFAFLCAMTLGYMMTSWIPTMLSGAGWDQRSSSLGLLTFNCGGLVGTACAAVLMGFFSSRILSWFAIAGVVVALAVAFAPSLAVLDPRIVLSALFALGACVIAVTSPLFALASHIYPTRARSAGIACAVAFGRLGAIASSFIGAAVSKLDSHGVAYFYLAAALLGGSTLALLLIKQHTLPTLRPAQS